MKSSPLKHRYIWGVILIFIGVSMAIKTYFGINIDVIRILFDYMLPFFVIYLGFSIMLSTSDKHCKPE